MNILLLPPDAFVSKSHLSQNDLSQHNLPQNDLMPNPKIKVTSKTNADITGSTASEFDKVNLFFGKGITQNQPSQNLTQASQNDDIIAIITDTAQLTHIRTVLQAVEGETLKIGKLGGNIGTGVLLSLTDRQAILTDVRLDTSPPAKLGVTVLLALPRPKVLRRLVMDMTAIGVNEIILINSYRTDKSYWGSPLLARLEEFVKEGLQQGVDTVMPQLRLAKRFKPFVQDELPQLINKANQTNKSAQSAVVFHPKSSQNFGQYTAEHGLPQVVIIGAEGGFIPYEIELLQSVGVQAVSLGERILRTESAVNAVLGRWLG